MKKIFALLLIIISLGGCSKNDWMTQYYLFRAETAFNKAYDLRVKPGSDFERMKYYRQAHDCFIKAFRLNPKFFTLARIEQAQDACLRLEDKENESIFQKFGDEYVRAHPKEAEYGAAGMPSLE